ncbi:MAG: hypothetical protein ABR613_06215 [Actinomycetota bacterium]
MKDNIEMEGHKDMSKRTAVAVAVGALLIAALAAPTAGAAASAGLSTNCDHDGHCVKGSAMSTNGGTTVSVVPAVTEVGTAVAICTGVGPGASLIQISCSIGGNSRTMSFPGSAGAVPLITTTGTLERKPVCWNVLGIFPVLTGAPHQVPTGGCAQVAV